MRTSFRRHIVLAAAISPLLAAVPLAHGGGNWDGEELGFNRSFTNPLNWDNNTVPTVGTPIVLGLNGAGSLNLMGGILVPSWTFNDWTRYFLHSGQITTDVNGGSINVGATHDSPYGSDYFFVGTTIPDWNMNSALGPGGSFINFTHAETGSLRISGLMMGPHDLTITATTATPSRGVYIDQENSQFSGKVNITTGTAVHLLDTGFNNATTGTGAINLQGGTLNLDSSSGVGKQLQNRINSLYGTIKADHNFTNNSNPAYNTTPTTHLISGAGNEVTVDNPTNLGATNDAYLAFTANNNNNFFVEVLRLSNTGGGTAGARRVDVWNGVRTTGWAGSTRVTSNNRLEEEVVTTTIGRQGGPPALFDFDFAAAGGMTLVKGGSGVLAIGGNNSGSSTGRKEVIDGVLRFVDANSYGTTAGFPSPVTLMGGPGPVSTAMGVGYSTDQNTTPLITTGTINGQAGAFCIDGVSNTSFFPALASSGNVAMRLGSSGFGALNNVATFHPYDDMVNQTSTYYLGGGGGMLSLDAAWGPAMFQGATIEMGTSGNLLPGRVNVYAGLPFGPVFGNVNIRAGTLDLSPPGMVPSSTGTSLGCYSTTLSSGGTYQNAPGGAGGSFNGPGQLLLDSMYQANGFTYFYGPAGSFGAAGLKLDGGAIGWAPTRNFWNQPVPVPALPGTYGATLSSALYQSLASPLAPIATNILHLGGEHSLGTMQIGFPITNNGGTRVAFFKSGADSIADLRGNAHTYTGGTAILGGEVQVDAADQLGGAGGFGAGAVVIADAGILHVMNSGGNFINFPQVLRVNNGVLARSSIINVDNGVTASFNLGALESTVAGSILEKTGINSTLEFLPPALYGFANSQNCWGLKASEGTIRINQLPRSATPAVTTGSVIFTTGGPVGLELVGTGAPGFIPIPAATRNSANYGFAGIQVYAPGAGNLTIGDGAFFRITGKQTSTINGFFAVNMGPTSVFKIAGDPLGNDTRGGGGVRFSGGNVQFTPGGGNILWPRDPLFHMDLTDGVLFSGCPDADFYGNLLFNSFAASPIVTIDGATAGVAATVAASTWTIGGTGHLLWRNTVVKGRTEAVPGAGGPYVSGTVNIDRNLGASITVHAGSILDVEFGTLNAGGTADPFTDTSNGTHLSVVNNASFNITAGTKHVLSIVGAGGTSVSAGATLDVGSSGPVSQGSFTVNGTADVGDVNVFGTTTVGSFPAFLAAHYVRGGALAVGTGDVFIKNNGGVNGVSNVDTLSIASGGQVNLRNNDMVVRSTPIGTWNGTNYTGVQGYVESGRNGGFQNGSGLITTIPSAVDPNFLTGLGVANASNALAIAPAATALWQGQIVSGGHTLVMYTYLGDGNLDGTINPDDYAIIDFYSGVAGAADYQNGDFNYDGILNADDYALIDFNFNAQGAPLSNAGMAPLQLVAIPEPAAAGLLAAGALLLRRRRDRGKPI